MSILDSKASTADTGLDSPFTGASVGLGRGRYSLMAYSVNQRNQEIGIRMAMGASQPEVRHPPRNIVAPAWNKVLVFN